MKSKIVLKALEEVWEIKERIYREDKDCSVLESLRRAHKVTEQVFKGKKNRGNRGSNLYRCT